MLAGLVVGLSAAGCWMLAACCYLASLRAACFCVASCEQANKRPYLLPSLLPSSSPPHFLFQIYGNVIETTVCIRNEIASSSRSRELRHHHHHHPSLFYLASCFTIWMRHCLQRRSYYKPSTTKEMGFIKLTTTLVLLGLSIPTSLSFVVKPSAPTEIKLFSTSDETLSSTRTKPVAVLICPAQFCVPKDYESLISTLQDKSPLIISGRVANLPRTEWIKVAKQLPTSDFFSANLNNAKTLQWYFDAIETGVSDIFAEHGEDIDICIIGHSIGGWVARSYLGGLSQSSTAVYRSTIEKCTSLVTLGSPHKAPDTALVDQTRGLLRTVEETPSCSADGLASNGISVTCVGSTAVQANLLTTDLEELVAATSYLPLVEDWKSIFGGIRGDGIIPKDLAFMEGCENRVEVETCSRTGNNVRHAHVLPTPYNLWDPSAPSIPLPEDFCWYGSEGVIGQWMKYI